MWDFYFLQLEFFQQFLQLAEGIFAGLVKAVEAGIFGGVDGVEKNLKRAQAIPEFVENFRLVHRRRSFFSRGLCHRPF